MNAHTHRRRGRLSGLSAIAAAVMLLASGAQAQTVRDEFSEFEHPELNPSYDFTVGPSLQSWSAPVLSAGGVIPLRFEAVNQYDAASFSRNFIPPDTMGAIGTTQYMATANGVYGIFDKTTGARLSVISDTAFWAAAGQTGSNGDSRVLFNADANRWIVVSFGASVSDLQIAVSNTSNALGGWQSVKFTGYAGLPGVGGGTADYPTLAMDKNAVYIGTNDFAPSTAGGSSTFRGTTLNVIPLNSLFSAGAPSIANAAQFVTPYSSSTGGADYGYAIQGVNSRSAGSSGKTFSASLFNDDNIGYTITGLNPASAAAATRGPTVLAGTNLPSPSGPARQPNAVPDVQSPSAPAPGASGYFASNDRVVDSFDSRISSSVYESGGRIYALNAITPTGTDYARVHYTVLDATSFAVLSQGDIGTGNYDYFQGSIAVNSAGKVVIGYNRSGRDVATGNISIMAQSFDTAADGSLVATSGEILIQTSLVDDYHNGGVDGQVAYGRQRWGDYSQVSIDPNDETKFWLIGEYAREYNDAAGGHAGGSGGSRWSTYVAEFDVSAVPEPASWMFMLFGFAAVGAVARRRRDAAAGTPAV